MSCSTRWILEFDYTADPEVSAETVRADLFANLSLARGPFTYDATRITFSDSNDALTIRLRFNENIVAVERA
ncbi:MAG: hypothetical protein EOP84_12670 [Verrucomicrobiaceae bacterium]|nr:MAG: hypothetical protein EOP84_12670 [Verrucomicrobiaceae bacterium]